MSNDLINRKALYERVEKSMYENPHSDSKVRQIHNHEHAHFLCMIMQEPTAFDKEKVHDELVKLRNAEIYNPDATNRYDEARSQGRYSAFLDAIRIVEKGGIE